MIRELFDLAMSLGDSTKELGGTVRLDFTKRRIRSISAFSSNSIFYFPVATTNQCTQEEYTMISRMLERQYAAFVVACISLVPFHRIKADDQASVEEYLSQFHQNMGFSKGGRDFGTILARMDSISEAAMGDFFYNLWNESKLTHTNPAIHLIDNYKSLSESYGKHNVDTYASIFTARQRHIFQEMSQWGFVGITAPISVYEGNANIDESTSQVKYSYDGDSMDDEIDKRLGKKPGYFREKVSNICHESGLSKDVVDYGTSMIDDNITFTSDDDNTFAVANFSFTDKYKEEPKNGIDDSDMARLNQIASSIKSRIPHIADASVRYQPADVRKGKIVVNIDPSASMHNDTSADDLYRFAYDDSSVVSDVKEFSRIKQLDSTNISDMTSIEELTLMRDILTRYIELYKMNLQAYKSKWITYAGKKIFAYFMNTLYNDPRTYMKDYYDCVDIATDRVNKLNSRIKELYRTGDFTSNVPERSHVSDNIVSLMNDDIAEQEDIGNAFIIYDDDEDEVIEESAIFNPLSDDEFYDIIDEAFKFNGFDDDNIGPSNKMHYDPKNVSHPNNKGDYGAGSNSIRDRDGNGSVRTYGGRNTTRSMHTKSRGTTDNLPRTNGSVMGGMRRSGNRSRSNSGNRGSSVPMPPQRNNVPAPPQRNNNQQQPPQQNNNGNNQQQQNTINTQSNTGSTTSSTAHTNNNNGEFSGPASGVNYAELGRVEEIKTFDKDIFTKMDMQKANDALPTFAKCSVGFVIDGTEDVVMKDFLVGIKAYCHRIPSRELIDDLYQSIINKRKFLKFIKFVTGEESSLADLVFGIKELKLDAMDNSADSKKTSKWRSAIQRRKRWSDMAIPYLTKEYTPNMTIVITQSEVDFIRDHYGVDIMKFKHINMLMEQNFLLGFVIVDQADEIVKVLYDGHGYDMQEYSYSQLERENTASDRMMRELYRSLSR